MRPLYKTAWMELKLFAREPAAAFFTLVLPLLLLLLNGSAGPAAAEAGGVAVADLVPGYVALVIATTGLMVLPGTMASYREKGVLRRLRAAPVHAATVLAAQLLVQVLVAMVGLVILLVVGSLWFGLSLPADPVATGVAYGMALLGFFAFGFVLAAILPTARTTSAAASALYFPMIFFSGATWPRAALPEFARRIGDALPLTYVVEALRDPWIGAGWNVVALSVLAVMAVAGTLLAARSFRWE